MSFRFLGVRNVNAIIPLSCLLNHHQIQIEAVGYFFVTARPLTVRRGNDEFDTLPVDKNFNFLATLVKNEELSDKALQILKTKKMNEKALLQLEKVDLKGFKMSVSDACKLSAWIQIKRREEEAKLKKEMLEEEAKLKKEMLEEEAKLKKEMREEEEAERREKRNANVKKIQIYNPINRSFVPKIFENKADFEKYIRKTNSLGVVQVEEGKVPDIKIPRSYEELDFNKVYYFLPADEGPIPAPTELQERLAKIIKTRCDFASRRYLMELFGCRFEFVGNDVLLKDSNDTVLGDVDTLFRTSDSSIFVLLERKTTVNVHSSQNLFQQIENTASAFKTCVKDEIFCEKHNIPYHACPTVYSMLYFQAGDDMVVQDALEKGIFVLTDGLEFKHPPSFQPPKTP